MTYNPIFQSLQMRDRNGERPVRKANIVSYITTSRTLSVFRYEDYEVPDTMTVQGVYDTDVESNTFASMEGYRQYLEQKSAVTSATAMFQEELNKASGYGAVGGAFGLGWSAGGGTASQNGRRSESSNFEARSRAEGGVAEKNTQTFMAMLEINVLR